MVSPSQSTQKTKGEITGVIKRISGINGVVLEEEQIIFTTICVELYHTKTRSWSYSYIPASRERKTKMIIKTESNVEGWFYLTNPTSITRFTTQFDDHFDFDWLRPNRTRLSLPTTIQQPPPRGLSLPPLSPASPLWIFLNHPTSNPPLLSILCYIQTQDSKFARLFPPQLLSNPTYSQIYRFHFSVFKWERKSWA